MPTFTGTNADEIITPNAISNTLVRDPAGSFPSDVFDMISAGGGADTVAAGGGNDSVTLGSGNDRFRWSIGDDNDVVDGGADADTLDIFASSAGQTIELYAQNGYQARVFIAGEGVSSSTIETINIFALGGADRIHIANLAGTAAQRVNVDLGATAQGVADGAPDDVFVAATSGNDVITVVADGAGLNVTGLSAEIAIRGADTADLLQIAGGIGNDRIDASAAPAGRMSLTLSGGDGADSLIGSSGSDRLGGDAGNDTMSGRGGGDVMNGGAGDDKVAGDDGDDSLSGDGGNDRLDGGAGNDSLYGAEGDDTLIGRGGNDTLQGSLGDDLLKGGKGADQFVFAEVDLGMLGVDTIRGFRPGKDSIAFDLIAEIGAKLNRGEFHIGRKAKDGNDHVVYNDDKGILYFDEDGRGGDAAFAFASIGKHLELSHNDFEILIN